MSDIPINRVMKNCQAKQSAGFTRKELVAVLAGLALLSLVIYPFLLKVRAVRHRDACINNLRLVDGWKQDWATENKKEKTDIPMASNLIRSLYKSESYPYVEQGNGFPYDIPHGPPYCPDDPLKKFTNSYSANKVEDAPICKILPASHVLP